MTAATLAATITTAPMVGEAAAAPKEEQTTTTMVRPPFTFADTGTSDGVCEPDETCASTAEADPNTGWASCRSDVAAQGATRTSGTALFDDQVQVPRKATTIRVQAVWGVTGTAFAVNDARGNATLRLQVLDGDEVLLDSGEQEVLSVKGFGDVSRVDGPQILSESRFLPRSVPDELTLRSRLSCNASTDIGINDELPGEAHIDVTGDGRTRLARFDVTFVSEK